MFQKWQFSVFQNTTVVNVAKYLREFFEVSYNNEEILKAAEKIVETNKNAKLEDVKRFIEQSEFSMAIWSYLAKEWNITVSDEEAHTFLDEYYKNTNNSIREYKQDKEKFNKIKNDIELRKVIDAINNKFIVKLHINLTIAKEN
jgi:3-methyladenine DNA glycosylase Tag